MEFLSTCMSDFVKYVLNGCTFDSECSDCCKIHFVTTEVQVDDSDSEVEIDIEDCCRFRHKKINSECLK